MKIPAHKINHRFQAAFSEIEQLLKDRLYPGVGTHENACGLIKKYYKKNPHWRAHAESLQKHAKIRNILTHEQTLKQGPPILVRKCYLDSLLAIKASLECQVSVSEAYKRPVTCVSKFDTLEHVVRLAFDKEFSQFPVVDEGRFVGLITENEIVRWLGRKANTKIETINLASVQVVTVIKEKEPLMQGMPIFHFMRLDTFIPEVMGLFSREPALEAILLTQSGKNSSPIEGIVTQWDAARYLR